MENLILKIELTKKNAFKVMTFGEYLDVKRKGRTPNAAKPKKKVKKIELDDEDEENKETKDNNAINDEEEDEENEEQDGKKRKLENHMKMPSTSFAAKDYLGEFNFKTSPKKMGKPHSKSSPSKPVTEVNKKKTMKKKLENLEKKENLDKTMTDMKEEIKKAVSDNIKDLLSQLLEKQHSKQEATIKEEKQEKDGENEM